MAQTKNEMKKEIKKLEKKQANHIFSVLAVFGFIFGILYISDIIDVIMFSAFGKQLAGETLAIGKYNFGTGTLIILASLIMAFIGNPELIKKIGNLRKKK